MSFILSVIFFGVLSSLGAAPVSFKIPSTDKLTLTIDEYSAVNKESRNIVLLCHQAGWSRGEYSETGKWLAKLGYTVFAIDQRSGGAVNAVRNQTFSQARQKGLKTDYISAKPDIEAALKYLSNKYKKKIILVGSSYSAALSLRLAGEKNLAIKAVAAFSPGEYFPNKNYLREVLANIEVPTFVTASKQEMKKDMNLFKTLPKKIRTLHEPKVQGHHGSRALWSSKDGHQEYRREFINFLKTIPRS